MSDSMCNTDPGSSATVPQWVVALSKAYRGRPAVTLDDVTLSYDDLEQRSARHARGLLARGVSKGTRVGLLFGNGPDWVVWWAAVCRAGAVAVPLSTFLQPAELARVVRHSDLHAIVGQRHFMRRDFEAVLGDALPALARERAGAPFAIGEAPYLRWIALDGERSVPWSEAPDAIAVDGHDERWATVLRRAEDEVHADDEAIVIYTSGQSAEPKGVVHTHRSVLTKIHYLRGMYDFGLDTTTAITMPFFWVGGLTMGLLPTLDAGGVTTCTERSTWGSGPTIGSANTESHQSSYTDFAMFPALGMTETFGIYSWGREFRVPGFPTCSPLDELQPGFEVRLLDDDGEIVAGDGTGEITVRGPSVARRLHKVPREDVYDADGFYRTGDEGVRAGARVLFKGRLSDMIKTSGANVSPAEVERELLLVDGVAVAAVVGIPDPRRDQLVAAAVVLDGTTDVDAEEMRAQLARRLSGYKVPRKIVFLRSPEEIPKTPSMKIDKRALARVLLDADAEVAQ
jgi:acyl-CoA synthetase (AMP-forming)/AMP-acid ligase II